MKKIVLLLALLSLATPAAAQNPFSLINFGSTAVDTNSGNKSAGTLRVVLATDGTNPTTVFKIDLSGTSANATAIKVDGSAVTQPISAASLPLPTGASTAAKQPALGVAGTASTDVITVQGIASMTALKVDPSAVTSPISAASLPLPALAATSTKQSDGSQKTQIVDGSGNVIASTSNNLNVQCANCTGSGVSAVDNATVTESTSVFAPIGGEFLTTPGTVTTGHQAMAAITAHRALQVTLFDTSGDAITPSTDATTNTASQTTGPQIFYNGSSATPTAVGADGRSIASWADTVGRLHVTGDASMGKLLVTPDALVAGSAIIGKVGIDQTTPGTTNGVRPDTSGATGAAPPARADFVGGLGAGATGGFVIGVPVCDSVKAVSVTSATTQLMVTGVSGRHVRICSVSLVTAIANNVAFLSGTGATCGTGTAGMAGGTTAANGYNFAANGGLTLGSGIGTVMQTVATGDSVCLITSAAGPLAGTIAYTIY